MNSKNMFNCLIVTAIIIITLLYTQLYIRTEQLQAQVDTLQKQVTVYRQLVFNLYGKDGG